MGNYAILKDIVFVRHDAKRHRAPRWRRIIDFFASDSRASKDANPAFEYADKAFFVHSTLFDVTFFFRAKAGARNAPSIFGALA